MLMRQMVRSAKHGSLRKLVFVLAAAITILGVLPRVSTAGMIPADEAVKNSSLRGQNIAKIQSFLEKKEIAARLADNGLTQEEISLRVNELNDQQASEIAAQLNQMDAGGDAVGLLVSILVLILVILLILWLIGYINPDDFTTKLKKLNADYKAQNPAPAQ
jgi:hypothetical protein